MAARSQSTLGPILQEFFLFIWSYPYIIVPLALVVCFILIQVWLLKISSINKKAQEAQLVERNSEDV